MGIWRKKCALLLLLLLLVGCKDTLLTGLSERQANETIALLEKYQIAASKQSGEKKLFNVMVDRQEMKQAIALIADYRLPSPEDVEIDHFFPTDALVASPRAEKARLISAIEQKLQQSLLRLDEVVDVRVHISYPLEDENRLTAQPEKRISVLILHGPLNDATIFANKIRLLILNSYPDVKMANITVALFIKHEPRLPPPKAPENNTYIMLWGSGSIAVFALLMVAVDWRRRRNKNDAIRET